MGPHWLDVPLHRKPSLVGDFNGTRLATSSVVCRLGAADGINSNAARVAQGASETGANHGQPCSLLTA